MSAQSVSHIAYRLMEKGLTPLQALEQLGIEIRIRDDRLHARHPVWPVLLTDDIKIFIASHARDIAKELINTKEQS